MLNVEILSTVDYVAKEKSIPKNTVFGIIEKSIEAASRKQYGNEQNIRVEIDKKTGEIKIYKIIQVVEDDSEAALDLVNHIALSQALIRNSEVQIGDEIMEQLPPLESGRNSSQVAKQVIILEIKNAVLEIEFNEFTKRINENISGVVKHLEAKHLVIDLGGRAEARIDYSDLLPNENFSLHDRIKACIMDVKRDNKLPQVVLSRKSNQFLANLFIAEVPEIYDNTIEIKGIARDPGSRSKIAVYSTEKGVDPVGSCVGIRGSRVQAVINELGGEKIDIINWSSDDATYVVNALAPAEVSKVVIDENEKSIDVVVPNNQLSLAIGRRGQNVRLANILTGWKIEVLTDDQESKRRMEEFNNSTNIFMEALDVDEMIAKLLVAEGFNSVEEIAESSIKDLMAIQGFDNDISEELKSRAEAYIANNEIKQTEIWRDLGVSPQLAKIDGLNNEILIQLGQNGVKTLNDLADLSRDEFLEYCPGVSLSDENIDTMILKLRKKIYNKN